MTSWTSVFFHEKNFNGTVPLKFFSFFHNTPVYNCTSKIETTSQLSSSVVSTLLPPCRHRVAVASGRHQSLPTKLLEIIHIRQKRPEKNKPENSTKQKKTISYRNLLSCPICKVLLLFKYVLILWGCFFYNNFRIKFSISANGVPLMGWDFWELGFFLLRIICVMIDIFNASSYDVVIWIEKRTCLKFVYNV